MNYKDIMILVVDDDDYIRELVGTVLLNEGFQITEAKDGREAFEKMGQTTVDLCVLDIMMPNMDGIEFCRKAKRYYENMPILMLSAKGEVSMKVQGFEVGTDDYLTKPFEAAELLVRIKALLKRYKKENGNRVKIGRLLLDHDNYTVEIQGEASDIPMKEFELLYKLGGNPGRTISRDQLIEDVWGIDFEGNERTLDVHINRLRDRFPQEEVQFKITTIRGLGYRLEVGHE